MRSVKLGMWVGVAIAVCVVAAPQAFSDNESAVRDVIKTMVGANTVDNPRTSTTPDGYLKFVAAPEGNAFEPGATSKSAGGSDAIAKSFLQEHAAAFGVFSGVSFNTNRVKSENARIYVHLDQTYKGTPIFGAQALVQMKPDGTIVSVLSDIMRNAPRVYSGALSLTPTLTPAEAKVAAAAVLETEHPADSFETNQPLLNLYVPYVLGATGQVKLVYVIEVTSPGSGFLYDECILVDANTGSPALRIPMTYDAKYRTIYDANNAAGADPGTLKRIEGQAPSNIEDVDLAYDYYGDTYDFYQTRHGRDGIDDHGITMDATVRYCGNAFECPLQNAYWVGGRNRMYFGDGFVADDVVGHELTHGVTDFESDLQYFGESGALNESFSDVWGEFIDQTNGAGNDSPSVKWLMGEDIPSIGAIRNMKSPHQFGQPDTYLGDYWQFDLYGGDSGGVHTNSGVSNKLCYLLTDGEYFNFYPIDGLGIPTVADLYYECQTNLLTSFSDYPDFGDQMITAAENLGLSPGEKDTVIRALLATKIIKFDFEPVRSFRAAGKSGDNRIAVTWLNPTGGDFTGVDIVRNTSRFPLNNTDGTVIASVTNGDESVVDTPGVSAGSDVYYGIFPRAGTFAASIPLFARGTVGVDVDYLTEGFSNGTDLSYSQLTFVPTGQVPITGPATQRPREYFNYTTYTAHAATGSKIAPSFDGTLPVSKEDYYELPVTDDGSVVFSTKVPIPFFGRLISNFILAANGYIAQATQQYLPNDLNAAYTLESHFAVPRISFLYSDLDPRSGGEVWVRELDDRAVVTFENVPAYSPGGPPGQTFANTVQCELFYGGQIRFTYLDLTVRRAVVGLSDGNGVPLNVDAIFAGTNAGPATTNLTSLPAAVPLELQPIPMQYVQPGTTVSFTATALSSQGPPTYYKIPAPSDLGVYPITGETLDSQTGAFTWDTTGLPDGLYGMILCAQAGQYTSCQTVAITLVTSSVLPTATNLSVAPTSPRDSDDLVASYSYNHPSLPEGPTILYWFKNNAIVPAYTSVSLVPRAATKPGEQWYFQILPTTVPIGHFGANPIYLRGIPVLSPAVTIQPDNKVDANGDGKVNSVDLQLVVRGLLGMSQADIDSDVNGDGKEDASDVQTTINVILDKREAR